MKARTKLQQRVTRLSELFIPAISQSQKDWAYKECLPHLGYANKSAAFCLDCGESFSLDLINRKRATCPHCGQRLKIEFTRKTTHKFVNYFAITHVVEDFQVVANFELWAYYKKGESVRHFLHPILEDWILPSKDSVVKVTRIGLRHQCNWLCDCWNGNWEIRQDTFRWYHSNNRYYVYPRKYHPDSRFRPEYLKIGIDHHLQGINVVQAINLVPRESKAETLLKAKQYDLLDMLNDGGDNIYRFWPSIKIALRNNYKVKDAKMWIDYLDLLSFFKKDLHNSQYVCPKDLHKAHNLYMKRKKKILDRQTLEREYKRLLQLFGEYDEDSFSCPKMLNPIVAELRRREKTIELAAKKKALEEAEKEYLEFIKPFIEMVISSSSIQIAPLKNISEFKKEGEALNHCVYTNEYFKKRNRLILSARIKGKPIETIEVNLEKGIVVQSRGLQNRPSKYHEKIVSLVEKNGSKIKKLYKKAG